MIFHPLQEGVKPGEERLIAVLAQPAFLVALIFGIAACSSIVGLILSGRRPRGAEDNAFTVFDNLG